MSQMSSEQIRQIADAIARELLHKPPAFEKMTAAPPTRIPGLGDGVFATVDDAAKAAREAFFALDALGLRKRVKIIAALREALRPQAEHMAKFAHQETGLGRWEDKVIKNLLVIEKTPGPEVLTPTAVSGDHGLSVIEPAPFGVFGAITPCTNPTSTIICNAIGMLSAGNTVVFNVHPTAKMVSRWTVQFINQTIVANGGPPNCLTCVAEPTIKSAGELMKHPLIRILAVTGGGGVVEAAMNSGKRAICAGPGNPPAVVCDSAVLEKAGADIVKGHSFDNNVICVDEKEVIAVDRITDDLKAVMKRNGAVEIPASELSRLENVIFSKGAGPRGHATVNRDFVGKDASTILKAMGRHAGPEVRCLIVEVPNDHPLVWTEQMMPVLPITRVPNTLAGIDLAIQAEGGCFHTASMHSRNIDMLSKMAKDSNVSIFVKNGPHYSGLGEGGEGYTSFTIASPTGEGLTGPREFSRWRRCAIVERFRIV
jgi:acyl-CoA reductase-like NAD-dependent aldehyde dehydrogenase